MSLLALQRRITELTEEVEDLRHALPELTERPPEYHDAMRAYGLTPSQAALLTALIKANPKPVPTRALLTLLDWTLCQDYGEATLETLRPQISKLRKRLKDARAPIGIQTVWGVGYALEHTTPNQQDS